MFWFRACCMVVYIYIVYATVSTNLSLEYDEYEDEEYDDYTDINTTRNGTLQFLKELTNITKSSGETVKLRCEVKNLDTNNTNASIQIKWLMDFAPINPQTNKRIKIFTRRQEVGITTSYIKIKKLEPTDTGIYGCIASSPSGRIKSEAIINVTNKWGPTGGASNDMSSKKPSFEDTREGDITTFIPNLEDHVSKKDSNSPFTNVVLPSIDKQTVNNPDLFDKTTEILPVYNASQPLCQLYMGKTCKVYLENQFVFIQPPYTQRSIEEYLENAVLVVSQSNEISASCTKFVLPSLCFSAFPVCSNAQQIHLYQQQHINKKSSLEKANIRTFENLRDSLTIHLQRICKEECDLLETEICSREYAIAKRHPIISKVLDLEECNNLPSEKENVALNCLKLGLDRVNVEEDDTCFWGKGDSYRGVHDTSISGNKCIKWSRQFHIPLTDYPELIGHSYCRNPGAIEAEPYCFIEQNKKETCGLTKCFNVLLIYVIGSILGIILITSLLISYYCYKKKNKMRNIQNLNLPPVDKNIYGNGGPSSPLELNTLLPPTVGSTRSQNNKNYFQNIPNYTYKEVTFIDELGEGAFGKVYKGELKTKMGKIFVAVKSLKENASAKTQADFQREIELISELKHPNIICLMGIVVKQEPMCMLFEYMSEGDLHEFLITNSPNNGKSLTQFQFLHISIQIAQGMEYLSDNHYVHRDLAARNCLVSRDLVVKISDFGLSRDMYSCDYYRVQSKSLLPVRWMPPESILYGKFTTESDVWSYGVVLWEIFSYGLQPYYGYNNQEVINMIRARKLLPCPEACPSYCYALMVECWAELAIRRPSFGEISHRLKVWKQNGSSVGAYFKPPDVVTNPQKFGHTSKSTSHSSETPLVCPTFENQSDPSLTWERNLKKASAAKLNESQSSLTSRSSSLGNKTQSTSLSDQTTRHSRKSIDRKSQKSGKTESGSDRGNPRNVIVSTNGENIEMKLT